MEELKGELARVQKALSDARVGYAMLLNALTNVFDSFDVCTFLALLPP
jgi:hypothetical protein